jgi:hypothetical protein
MKNKLFIGWFIMLNLMVLFNKVNAQTLEKNRPFKIGDFLIVSPDTMKIDFIIKGEPLPKLISAGDTLYEDNKYLIRGNENIIGWYDVYGVFKKYKIPYKFPMFKVPVYKGRLAPPNFKTDTAALKFRTQIKTQCKSQGINFAGHYTLVKWGCGSGCKEIAIVDRITGDIYYSNVLNGIDDSFYTLECKQDSKLLVTNEWMLKDHKGYILCHDVWKLGFDKWDNSKFITIH